MASIAAILLAAGESTRMGEPKPLLPWRGQTLLEHQVAALASAGASRTVVVLGHESGKLESLLKDRAGVQWVYNRDYREGKTTSIKVGLRALRQPRDGSPSATLGTCSGILTEEAILLLNVDQPRSAGILRQVMGLHRSGGTAGSQGRRRLITVPTYRGKGGHPIIVSTSLMAELEQISEVTQGLKAVIRRHKADTQRVDIDSPEILLDLNTRQDYQKALDMSGST